MCVRHWTTGVEGIGWVPEGTGDSWTMYGRRQRGEGAGGGRCLQEDVNYRNRSVHGQREEYLIKDVSEEGIPNDGKLVEGQWVFGAGSVWGHPNNRAIMVC